MVCKRSSATIAISTFILLHLMASRRHRWSRQLPWCNLKDGNSIAEMCKREKLCAAQQPLAMYLLLQQQSQQILPARGEAGRPQPCQGSREPGRGWPSLAPFPSPLAEEGLGPGQIFILPPLPRAAAFGSSCRLSFTCLLIKLMQETSHRCSF